MNASSLPTASANSRAAVSGRLSSVRSASGTAMACMGVSMSPGSSDITGTPSAAATPPAATLLVLALVCFVGAALGWSPRQLNLTALGLAFYVLQQLVVIVPRVQ